MKGERRLDAVVGASHERLVRVTLHTADGAEVGNLPIVSGEVLGVAAAPSRWSARLRVAGAEWAPTSATSPLAGFTPHYARIFAGAVVDTLPVYVELARLLVAGATLTRTPEEAVVDVELIGLDQYVADGAVIAYRPELGRSCQQAIADLYRKRMPAGWKLTVVDSTAPVPVPAAFTARDVSPAALLADLCAAANVTSYADAAGRLVIRDPLPDSPRTPPARAFDVDVDVTGYTVSTGRDGRFANRVAVEYQPVADLTATKQRIEATWDRVTTADPAAGAFYLTATRFRVGYRDRVARQRKRSLRRVAPGDLVQIMYGAGVEQLLEVQTAELNDSKNYLDCEVVVLDTDGAPPATETNVAVAVYAAPENPTVGTAELLTGPTGVVAAGAVDYRETRLGTVTQAQANARASALLAVMLRGWITTTLDAVPDPRVEPDDDVTVTYYSGQTLDHRVSTVRIPLGPADAMTLTLRTFSDTAPSRFDRPTPAHSTEG